MIFLVSRTCTKIDKEQVSCSYPLDDYRDTPAYVLLGEPGMGKTEAFKNESKQQENSIYVTARDLITFRDKPEWHKKILFIDGLDEVRSTGQNTIEPFEKIRRCLNELGKPQFRLSCRKADWQGNSDKNELQKVAPDNNEIVELHLDELTEDNINTILKKNYQGNVPSPSHFIEEAKSRGLFGLIKNPQILDMLVSAITDSGEWPDSRQSTFEFACRKILLVEHNRVHSDPPNEQPQTIDKQLEAGGYLCTLLLLSEKPGFSLTPSSAKKDFPAINDLGYDDISLLKLVSKTKLFNTNGEYFHYSHRTVAEYLSAYYLKKQIEEKGLPVGRVLALITGQDGVAVTALRSLFAWLVTLCEKERSMLINRDPLGLVLYGDVKLFSVTDKKKILEALKKEVDRNPNFFTPSNLTEQPFGALCTSDMELYFKSILESPDRSLAQQALVYYVLVAMIHGDCLIGLIDYLLVIVRDPNWYFVVREQTLNVLIRYREGKQPLRQLLEDINKNNIQDWNDDLLGSLLNKLYPDVIKPAAIFDYLHIPKNQDYIGMYDYFWSQKLSELSGDEMIPELLNELVLRHEKLIKVLSEHCFRSMISSLLEKGLEVHGETVPIETLSGWLGLSMLSNDKDETKQIRNWIGLHPDIQKSIIELHTEKCIESKEFYSCMCKSRKRLYNGLLPEDYGLWCLDKAKQSNKAVVSEYFIHESIMTLFRKRGNEGLSLELLEQTAIESPKLETYINNMLVTRIAHNDYKFIKKRQEQEEKEQQNKKEYIQFVQDNIDAIRAGTASSDIFCNLGMAYYGHFIDFDGETPCERLSNYFDNKILVDSILTGFTKCPERDDVPTVKEIFKLNAKGQMYRLSLPIRAGLKIIMNREESKKILQLPENKIRKILAFYFADSHDNNTAWYWELVSHRPELVAEIFIKYGLTLLREKGSVSHLYSLAFDEKYSDIARHVSIPILVGFPVRSTNNQLEYIGYLLKAAFQHSEHRQLKKLIEKKLKLTSMNIAQRTYWFGVAFVLSPAEYKEALLEYVGKNAGRVNYLSQFFTQCPLTNDLPEFAFALLIKLFGPCYSPHNPDDVHEAGMILDSWYIDIYNLINKLSMMNSNSATEEINGLINEEKLSQWRTILQGALSQQQANKREADFSHPDIKQVSETINNRAPANVADLAALVFQHIKDLAYRIRNGATDDYKQYWNMDDKSKNVFIERKHEELCRDAFLSDLKERLSPCIEAVAEGYYADSKRADIRVSYGGTGGFNVPIEIKCNDHQYIWYAIREQLIAQYTRDPGAHGYGIYLVFWFGADKTAPQPEGSRPKTPKDLETRLLEQLTTKEECQQISICVIDCSEQIKK